MLGGKDVAVDALGLFGVPLQEAGSVVDFTPRFADRFAHLPRHGHGEDLLGLQHRLVPGLEQRRALERGGLAPGFEAALGVVGSQLRLLDAAIGDLRDHLAGGGRTQRVAACPVGIETDDGGGIVGGVSGGFERRGLALKRR